MVVICSKELVFLRELDKFKIYLDDKLNLISQWKNFGVSEIELAKIKLKVLLSVDCTHSDYHH